MAIDYQPTLKLPVERMEQIRAIGDALGMSLVDVIGHLVRKEIAAGTIKADLPGVRIAATEAGVTLGFEGASATLKPSQAIALADRIVALANGSSLAGSIDGFVRSQAPNLRLRDPDPVHAERRGTGLKITVDGTTRAFALDVARDLAGLLRTAAAANK